MFKFRFLLIIIGIFFSYETNSQLLRSNNKDGKIVGGSIVDISSYSYIVTVRFRNYYTGNFKHWCGGCIYNETVIITAAHCVYRRSISDFKIRAGSQNNNKGGQLIDVANIIIHENYNQYSLNNDIALLILNDTLKYSETVSPINLPDENTNILPGTKVNVSGWGVITEGSRKTSDKLQAVEVEIINKNECENTYGGITDAMLCAGVQKGSKDACQGDSGGPLVNNNTLIGIVSWGYGCAREGYPGVYTNILNLFNWILENL